MADELRAQRQKALADKKRRLEELKARRSQRTSVAASNGDASASLRTGNLDEYIDGLLKTKSPATGAGTASPSFATNGSGSAAGAAVAAGAAAASVASSSMGASSDHDDSNNSISTGGRQLQKLPSDDGISVESMQSSSVAAFPPPLAKKVETFEIATQTAEDEFPPGSEHQEEEDETGYLAEQVAQDDQQYDGTGAYDPNGVDGSYRNYDDYYQQEESKLLTKEEIEREVTSQTFSSFLNSASKKVERVLGTSVLADLLTDYAGETDTARKVEAKASDGSKYLSSRQIYECPKWTANRDVTDMDWSPLHRELMLASYHMPNSTSSASTNRPQPKGSSAVTALSPDDTPSSSLAARSVNELQSDGLALIWSLAMPNRPEHIFTCGSPVLSARFHPTEPPLVIGGCESGQVVVWDVRAGRMPVQKSSLMVSTAPNTGGSSGNTSTTNNNIKGHTHPICAMEIVDGGSGLVTAASDGRVNFWSLGNLRDPMESVQVSETVSCMAVAPESETIVCGDEFGNLYAIQQTNSGNTGRTRRQVRKVSAVETQHFGMLTSVSTKLLKTCSRAGLSKGFLRGSGGLVLSTGVDWTVKLWSPAVTDQPLLSLVSHSYDYMSDVTWSPAHPALCATASSNGTVGLWNFAQSLDEPLTGSDGIVVEPDASSGRGLNKLKWSTDGRRMLVASADRVHVLSLSEDAIRQKGDEDMKMMNQLTTRGLLTAASASSSTAAAES